MAYIVLALTADGRLKIEEAHWNANLANPIADAASRKPLENYATIFAHPVLFKSRAPYVAPPPPPPAPAVAPAPAIVVDPGLALSGVIITNGLSKAYLSSKAGPEGVWTSEGESFQGWRVKSVHETAVQLEQGSRSIELQLYPRN